MNGHWKISRQICKYLLDKIIEYHPGQGAWLIFLFYPKTDIAAHRTRK